MGNFNKISIELHPLLERKPQLLLRFFGFFLFFLKNIKLQKSSTLCNVSSLLVISVIFWFCIGNFCIELVLYFFIQVSHGFIQGYVFTLIYLNLLMFLINNLDRLIRIGISKRFLEKHCKDFVLNWEKQQILKSILFTALLR